MTDSSEEISAGNLSLCAVCRIARSNVWIIPKKLCDGYTPFHARRPTTLSKHPSRIRIFETIDRIAEADSVLPVHIRKLIIAVARSRPVGKNFVEISVGVVLKNSVSERGVAVSGCPQQLCHHRQWRISDSLVVHRLVVTTVRSYEVSQIKNVIENLTSVFA